MHCQILLTEVSYAVLPSIASSRSQLESSSKLKQPEDSSDDIETFNIAMSFSEDELALLSDWLGIDTGLDNSSADDAHAFLSDSESDELAQVDQFLREGGCNFLVHAT